MTLNEITQIITERAGRPFDQPFRLQVKDLVKLWRMRLMKESMERHPNDKKFFLQKFVAPLTEVDIVECPFSIDCNILRTGKLPKPIRTNSLFDFVGTVDFSKTFTYSQPEVATYHNHAKWTGHLTRYSYVDNYIYIHNPPTNELEYIGIRGIFEDPAELQSFYCDSNADKTCYTDDVEFPIPGDLIQPLIQSILATELKIVQPERKEEIKVNG